MLVQPMITQLSALKRKVWLKLYTIKCKAETCNNCPSKIGSAC